MSRMPRELNSTVAAFRMRHHDRKAPVIGRERREAALGTIRVLRIVDRRLSIAVSKSGRSMREHLVFGLEEFNASLAVTIDDRHHRTGHSGEKNRGGLENFNRNEACFKLFRTIAQELRPV